MEDDTNVEVELSNSHSAPRWWVAILETLISVIVAASILVFLARSGKDYQTSWVLISILPILLWLFLSGRVVGFKAFGIELKSAIRRLSDEKIKPDHDFSAVNQIEFEPISADPKADATQIQSYVERKVAALYFELGRRSYYDANVIRKYLDALTEHRFFKWIVFQYPDGRFAGLIAAHMLRTFGQLQWEARDGYTSIKNKIESSDVRDLPGIIEPESALHVSDTKRQAVEQFSKVNIDDLPVIDQQGKFVGVLNRGKLVSELLASIMRAAKDAA